MMLYPHIILIILGLSFVRTQSINSTNTHHIITAITTVTPTASSIISDGSGIPTPVTTTSSIPFTRNTNANAVPTVQSTEWDPKENNQIKNDQSWLKQNNRFVFIIFLGLFLIALISWYVTKSVKGMRKRLERENQEQLYMMQQASGRSDHVIPEPPQAQPPAYKTDSTYTPLSDNMNQTRY
ncbi:hypothetical protein BDB01DRAFT_800125 [Pilobolus umbonatus]|nr:hypothetical protein BDB01DRAFT_800125 [Pilobolus umbonatus]